MHILYQVGFVTQINLHFAIFKYILVNGAFCIMIWILWKVIPIDN